ncbi:hypothetical protein RS82_01100 [Microbacterium trichothecenolyticum]|uniref:Uncharacterized protein n=1 Tax=Microbacterium trichothecenolyticum TaxID=69370 RepID=A0A0M2HCA6_MICTR|nr:hypothetical protein RS82_01100 [Microbacterium trichothecenolyticum]
MPGWQASGPRTRTAPGLPSAQVPGKLCVLFPPHRGNPRDYSVKWQQPERMARVGAVPYYAATEFEARMCRANPVLIVGGRELRRAGGHVPGPDRD